MPLLTPQTATPRCKCVVDLISKVQRPFLFLVTVFGQPPHSVIRKYHVRAPDDASAASKGLELFVDEFTPRRIALLTASNVPKAKQE
jgi:hypothetical protein